MKSPQGEVNGDFISYDRANEFFQVLGAAPGATSAPNARVKATLIPPKKGADAKDAKPDAPLILKPDTAPATAAQ